MLEWKVGDKLPWLTEVVDQNGVMVARCVGDDHEWRAEMIAKAVNEYQRRRKQPVRPPEARP